MIILVKLLRPTHPGWEKRKYIYFHIGSTPRPSSKNTHIARQKLYRQLNLEPPKLWLCQLTKKLATKIAPHISSALRYLGVIFDEYILSGSSILAGADRAGTADSCYGKKNEKENTHNNVIDGDIRRDMTVDTDQKYQG